eukprot:92428_1
MESPKPPPFNLFTFTFTDALQYGVQCRSSVHRSILDNLFTDAFTFTFTFTFTYDLGPFAPPELATSRGNGVIHVQVEKLLRAGHKLLPSFCADIIGSCMEFNGTQYANYQPNWTRPGLVFNSNKYRNRNVLCVGSISECPSLH